MGSLALLAPVFAAEEGGAGESVTYDLTARQIAAGAAGQFRGDISWSFTLGGQNYTVNGIFTHNNGWQIGFATLAQAQAFVAAGYTIDTGISGQSTIDSGDLTINTDRFFAQVTTFAGRYIANGNYTITIST